MMCDEKDMDTECRLYSSSQHYPLSINNIIISFITQSYNSTPLTLNSQHHSSIPSCIRMKIAITAIISLTGANAFSIVNNAARSATTQLFANRQPIMAGNWKMNPPSEEDAIELASSLTKLLGEETCPMDEENDFCTEVVIFPPFPFISKVKDVVEEIGITVGAQSIFFEDKGAYTGSVAASMVKSVGCEYVLCGHSERRTLFSDSDDTTLGTPCTYGQPSRWKRVWTDATGLECNVNVHPMTQSLFSDLILENEDDNLHVRDVTSIPDGVSCHRSDDNKKQLVVQISDDENSCWKSIHPEQFNVYDMTSWSHKHPGNRASYNPIMEFAKRNETELKYPDHHPMQRWNEVKEKLHYIGRFGDDVDFVDLPDIFKVRFVAETFGIFSPDMEEGKGVVVCGSPGEVPNKPSRKDALANAYTVHGSDTSIANDEALVFDGRTFDITQSASVDRTSFLDHKQQKKTVWTMVTLKARDQLRQRMAW